MVYSLGIVLLIGFLAGKLLDKVHIPGLVGMVLVGFLFGPYCLQVFDPSLLQISSQLRQIALVIILTRSGLNLDLPSLKKVGRPAVLMCFVPATFEIVGVTLAAHYLLELSIFESMLLGSVLAAVSPAVVSPRMIKYADERYGEEHAVPKLVLAGSSADDIYVIVLFYAFLGLVQNDTFNALSIAAIPLSMLLGIILGIAVGAGMVCLFKKLQLTLTVNVLLLLSVSFLMLGVEEWLKPYVPVSALLAITVMGMTVLFGYQEKAKELAKGYNQLWTFFEIILFVLVGASVDFSYAFAAGPAPVLVLFIGLSFRTVGVIVSLLGTPLTKKERLFAAISYLPKATVQASIGGIALSYGLPCGSIVLTLSVIAILITAPLGALLIDNLGKKLLIKSEIKEKICRIIV